MNVRYAIKTLDGFEDYLYVAVGVDEYVQDRDKTLFDTIEQASEELRVHMKEYIVVITEECL